MGQEPDTASVDPALADLLGRDSTSRDSTSFDQVSVPDGTPYLMSPAFEYDIELNAFFYSAEMLASRATTRLGYARDLRSFFTFLQHGRGVDDWRGATEEDHRAYLIWRREDPAGPRISDATWDRELSAVNRFFAWQVSRGHLHATPIRQRERRPGPRSLGRSASTGTTPATYSHGARRSRLEWFPAPSYRRWRDVGVRGYGADGLPDPAFRGRWADRNAAFVDLMVRTGLRLAEQASLTIDEVPRQQAASGYQRFWLPAATAKSGSARWIYAPVAVLRDLDSYVRLDRAGIVAVAQAAGVYRRLRDPLVMEPGATTAATPGSARQIKIVHLTPDERRRLLVDGPEGLEPASFWLSEQGLPLSVSSWKDMFRQANVRCERHGLDLHGHAHMLRHTFAVLTLEQLQRGHLKAMAALTPAQRGHYTRIFGDPLNWVRMRLGHRSVVTTQIYLHALEELEMETRLALTSEAWDDPRDPALLAASHAPAVGHEESRR